MILYHLTTERNLKKIIRNGILVPTKNIINDISLVDKRGLLDYLPYLLGYGNYIVVVDVPKSFIYNTYIESTHPMEMVKVYSSNKFISNNRIVGIIELDKKTWSKYRSIYNKTLYGMDHIFPAI